ncbi:MAG: S-layer homology domain-containing protein [Anaerolineales bacterium]|nr:S-layer homology domain-containing protein [Anaerolineales bacterium]
MKISLNIRNLFLVILLLGLVILPAGPVRAAGLVVNTLTDENDGSCIDADCSLRDAIAVASPGDSITFSVTGTIILSMGELIVNKNLTITGPGSGQLTLDGNNASRIFNMPISNPISNTVIISGMTMTKGYADPNMVCGGGAIANNAFLTMDDVIITNNSAPAGPPITCAYPRGGAITVFGNEGSLTITNSTISDNTTFWDGGGIYFDSVEGSLSLTNVLIDNNESTNSGAGGLYVGDATGTVTFDNVIVTNNTGAAGGSNGGGMVFYEDNAPITIAITNSRIALNSARNGGGIYNYLNTLTVTNSTIADNSVGDDGGGLYNNNGTVIINSSTLEGNVANTDGNSNGGGIYNLGNNGNTSSITIVNSTLTGNSSTLGKGGAIYNQASGGTVNDIATINILNSTIVGNSARNSVGGGGILATTASSNEVSTVTLSNSIVYGNTLTTGSSGENCAINNTATIVKNNHNLFQTLANDCFPGVNDVTSALATSAVVNALANNGGATQTMLLPVGSPAIDAGDTAICGASPVDNESQNGLPRSQGGLCDIGAYEHTAPTVTSITRANPSPTNAASVNFTVTFSEDVTNVAEADFSLNTSGVSGASITTVMGSGSTRTVTVNTGTGNGSIRLDLPLTASIQGLTGYTLTGLAYTSGQTYTITKNFAPTDISLSASSVTENLPAGTEVGTFASTDPDVGNTFTYSLVSGTGSEDNAAFSISGNKLLTAQPFNFLNKNSYSIRVRSTDNDGLSFEKAFAISVIDAAPIFADVPDSYWAVSFIERLYNAGITGGCSTNPLNYCPESTVTRAQMAVFLLKGIHGSSYAPPAVGASTGFGDVATDYWAAAWIKQLAAEAITGGCGGGNYCPDSPVTRAQMAVFLLKAKYGSSYSPPAIGSDSGFSDVAVDYWAAAWIKQLAAEGITSGCAAGTYCPETAVTRAQMAVFLVKAFGLP